MIQEISNSERIQFHSKDVCSYLFTKIFLYIYPAFLLFVAFEIEKFYPSLETFRL